MWHGWLVAAVARLLALVVSAIGAAYAGGGEDAYVSRDADIDYSSWAVDPTAPGPDVPPVGRSLFDHLFTERVSGERTYRVPFPFTALTDRIEARLANKELFGGTRFAMIPLGRSLQRTAAAPDFFRFPRIVFAVTGEPAISDRDAGMLLKDRLYVGYVEKTGTLEVISYNEAAGRFEFQLVKDYRAGAQAKVFYANRAICISCHQNHAPIFSRAIWGETNANGKVAALLRAQRADFNASAQANIDFPDDIDKSTVRASNLMTLQQVWRQGCANAQDRSQSRRCRAAAFTALLQYGLSGGQELGSGAANYQSDFVATFANAWRRTWPQGLRAAQSSLPDRNPFGSSASYYGAGDAEEVSLDWIAASHVPPALDPLNPRPAREIWRVAGTMDAYRFIPGWAKFLAADDFSALNAHLVQRAGSETFRLAVYRGQCHVLREATASGFKFDCTSEAAAADGVNLSGRFDAQGSGRVTWLSLGPAGQLRDLAFHGERLQQSGSGYLLRVIPKKGGLAARLPDGRALARIQIRWPVAADADSAKPIAASVEIVVLDDFALVRQAIDRLLARQASLFDDGPLVRTTLLRALFSELGMPERSWCCVDDHGMPPALTEMVEMNASAIEKREWQPLFQYCALCHLTGEQFPPNFLAGDARQVAENLRQCAPRMLVRLSAWRTPVGQRVKSPMPPATALRELGTTMHAWTGSADLGQLRAYIEGLVVQDGRPADMVELVKDGYESLPRCLPDAGETHAQSRNIQ
jgi:hypothetical protein